MDYGSTALTLVDRIRALIPAHPEILAMNRPPVLEKINSTRLIKSVGITRVLVNDSDREHSYQMSIPAGDPTGDGSLGWRLNYGGEPTLNDLHSAISIMESYEYLLSSGITTAEAINRLRCLRREYQRQHQKDSN
jgi:hypothetical protein